MTFDPEQYAAQKRRTAVERANWTPWQHFWNACPKKVGKAMARVKFDAVINGGLCTRTLDRDSGQFIELTLEATADELIEGMRRYAETQYQTDGYGLKDDGRYTLHPSTWINRGGWMDG